MPRRRHLLLRVANVNPDSVTTHTDRVLYSAIGVFILLYFVYATVGGAAFADASANYTHPWWMWLVGPLVATGVVELAQHFTQVAPRRYDACLGAPPAHALLTGGSAVLATCAGMNGSLCGARSASYGRTAHPGE
jgi:hypothetical protein